MLNRLSLTAPSFASAPNTGVSRPVRFAGGPFTAQVDYSEKEIAKALGKWVKNAKSSQSGRNPATKKIAQNIIDTIKSGQLAAKGLILITARDAKKKVNAVALLEAPANKTYTILQDLVNANKPEAKGSGRTALAEAKEVTRTAGRDKLLLYSLEEGSVDFYGNNGFTFIRTVPDFPNGIWGLDVQA